VFLCPLLIIVLNLILILKKKYCFQRLFLQNGPDEKAQVVTEGINTSTTLENSYNLMQSFIQAVETGNTHELKSLINCQDQIGTLMHKTLLIFKHNLTAVLNGAALPYSNGCLEGFNRKIKQIERTAFGYSNFTNLLTRIRLEEDLYKEKEPNSLLMVA
jgi:transposase